VKIASKHKDLVRSLTGFQQENSIRQQLFRPSRGPKKENKKGEIPLVGGGGGRQLTKKKDLGKTDIKSES